MTTGSHAPAATARSGLRAPSTPHGGDHRPAFARPTGEHGHEPTQAEGLQPQRRALAGLVELAQLGVRDGHLVQPRQHPRRQVDAKRGPAGTPACCAGAGCARSAGPARPAGPNRRWTRAPQQPPGIGIEIQRRLPVPERIGAQAEELFDRAERRNGLAVDLNAPGRLPDTRLRCPPAARPRRGWPRPAKHDPPHQRRP